MARERMVTRTINETVCTVMICNVNTASVNNEILSVTGEYENDGALLMALKKNYETDTEKIVAIICKENREILYGLPEIEFIKYATVLPSRIKVE